MESRKNSVKSTSRLSKAADLPVDFTKIVKDVFTTNFADGMKLLKKHQKTKNGFEIRGAIFADEIVLAASLVSDGQMAATTIYCSVDFDPKASTPTAQDLLAVCVDAVGSLFGTILDPAKPERIELLAAGAAEVYDELPLEWTKVEFESRRVYLLADKSNPNLDEMTDRWLAENDPEADAEEEAYDEETEGNFVSGKPGKGDSFH